MQFSIKLLCQMNIACGESIGLYFIELVLLCTSTEFTIHENNYELANTNSQIPIHLDGRTSVKLTGQILG